MTLKQREQAFVQLGLFINRHFSNQWLPKEERFHNDLLKLTSIAFSYNGWFTPESVAQALKGLAFMLEEKALPNFLKTLQNLKNQKR